MVAKNGAHVSAFTNANDVRIKTFTTNIRMGSKPTLKVLYQRVAPNAILNEGGRVDDAKCHPGTREEVIALMEMWMNTPESTRILWLSGPAGGGKTAIMKTITERSANRGVQTVNFFFFRGDSTRNSAQPVVPTLLYQLFELYPPSSAAISNIFSTRRRILDGSIAQQCKLISTLFPIIRQSSPAGARIFLFIDGLDECDVDAERSQRDILHALEALVMDDDSPFRLVVASRPEAPIEMAFNQLLSQAQTIFLDAQYSPENDIRRFVTAEFDRIKASHPSARSLQSSWPVLSDVEGIVQKSSGQFIYAATVMRYIAHASTVPSLSLERVKGVIPAANNSPFKHLDSIYSFVLSRADNQDATRDVLSMKLLYGSINTALTRILHLYDPLYNQAMVQSCISGLSAVVRLTAGGQLEFYHASLEDFLVDPARSGIYWLDIDAFRAKVVTVLWTQSVGFDQYLQESLFRNLKKPTPGITHMLLNVPFPHWTTARLSSSTLMLRGVKRLYYKDDVETYKHIVRRYIRLLVTEDHNLSELDRGIPHVEEYLSFYENERGSAAYAMLEHNPTLEVLVNIFRVVIQCLVQLNFAFTVALLALILAAIYTTGFSPL